jgi:hypothetical protein
MSMKIRRIVTGSCLTITLSGFLYAQQMPQTSTQRVKTASTTKSEQLSGTVVAVDGSTLVVKMASGDLRTFNPPESRRFVVDGKELSLRELRPGTRLRATVTTTETAAIDRTTTVGTGKVWYVAAPNVILTLPNGENRQYKVTNEYKFNINGQPATVHELRKGMTVAAEKIVEVPRVELATNVAVTGTAPAEVSPVAAAPRPAARPEPTPVASAPPAPRRATEPAASTAAPAAAPAPSAAPARVAAAPEPAPRRLPTTASPLPLIGLAGLLCGGVSLLLRRNR